MKKLTGLLAASVTLLALSGCTTYHQATSYFTQPVVKDVKKGMTHDQVHAIAGIPATQINLTFARGTCETYIIGKGSKGAPLTYFVSYGDNQRVLNYGFQSCKEYDTDPQVK